MINLGNPVVALRWYIGIAVVTFVFTVGMLAYWFIPKLTEQPPQIVANVAPVVAKVETQEITPIKVITLKPEAKKKLKLPRAVQADPKQHVTAATKVEPSERPQLVTTVINEDTGESTTYVVEEPRPWIGVRDRGEVSLAYGIKKEGPVARLAARQELLQIKALGLGAVGTIDSDGDFFVGIGATYRW